MCSAIYFALNIIFLWFSGAVATKSCTTMDGQKGICVPVKNCEWTLTEAANVPNGVIPTDECGKLEDSTSLICCHRWKNSENCGRSHSANSSTVDRFPWVVDVLYQRRGRYSVFKCTGSLISDEYVLTAAHCVKDMPFKMKPYQVRVKQGDKHEEYEVQSSVVHPEFSTQFLNKINDIALLKLATKIKFSDVVQPVCLPINDKFRTAVSSNQSVSIFSRGPSKVDSPRLAKHLISMQVRDADICNEYYKILRLQLSEAQLCVGGEIGKDACPGDSGGPLMFAEDSQNDTASAHRWFQIGLISLGPQQCGTKIPGIYVNLLNYMDWIYATIGTNPKIIEIL